MTQPWRGKRALTMCEDTVNLGRAWTRRNVAVYLSPSKIMGQPAVHLEMRYSSAAACRRRGVKPIRDLLALDIDACIRRDIRFSAICSLIADKAINRLAEEKVRRHADRAATVKKADRFRTGASALTPRATCWSRSCASCQTRIGWQLGLIVRSSPLRTALMPCSYCAMPPCTCQLRR